MVYSHQPEHRSNLAFISFPERLGLSEPVIKQAGIRPVFSGRTGCALVSTTSMTTPTLTVWSTICSNTSKKQEVMQNERVL